MNELHVYKNWSITDGDFQGDTEYNNKYMPKEEMMFKKMLYFFSGAVSFALVLITLMIVANF